MRRSGKPVVLIANKCEGKAAEAGRIEAFSLGFGEPLPISAEHGQGIGYIYESINEHAEDFAEEEQGEEQGEELRPLQLALVGRPNVGKSTLVNALIEDERMLVSEVAGTTRDAIPVDWEWQGRKIRLVDTAGLRKKARIEDAVEKISASATINAVEKADIVILVLDADAILDKQDLVIASRIAEEGRGLVIAVNKWDAAEDRDASIKRLQDRIESSLSQFPNVPTVTISALRKKGLDKLMKAVLKVDEKWNARVSTGKLNRWFKKMLEANPPPRGKHAKQIKLRYITQTFTRPPSFVIFSSNPEGLPESYHRYLMNGLRETFEFAGVPIRISLRKNDNPYVDKED